MESLARTANRGSVSTGPYEVSNSLLLDNSDSSMEFNHHQMSTGGDDQWSAQSNAGTNSKKATISLWIKRAKLSPSSGAGQYARLFQFQTGGNATSLYFVTDQLKMYDDVTSASLLTTRKFRDTSAWYHIVLAMDSTQATAANRVKLYVNGEQQTAWDTEDYGNQNSDLAMFSTTNVTFYLGTASGNGQGYAFDGYITEFHFVDGAQKAASDFGEYDEDSGIWKPKEYTESYGTLGCYYNFEDTSSNRFNDESGNGNFMNNRGGSFEGKITTDTPTNNFATLNTLQGNNSKLTITGGATNVVKSGNHGWQTTNANIAVSVGKWYAEFKLDSSCDLVMIGVNQADNEVAWYGSHIGAYSNSTAQGMGYYSSNGHFYRNGGSGAIGSSYLSGDIIGIAFCYNSNGTAFMGMSKNGTWQNSQDPSSGTTNMLGLNYGSAFTDNEMYTFAISTHEDAGGVLANFGGYEGFTVSSGNTDANGYGNFEYAVPTGYYALCTKNLAEFG